MVFGNPEESGGKAPAEELAKKNDMGWFAIIPMLIPAILLMVLGFYSTTSSNANSRRNSGIESGSGVRHKHGDRGKRGEKIRRY